MAKNNHGHDHKPGDDSQAIRNLRSLINRRFDEVLVAIADNQKETLMKVSELAGALDTLSTSVEKIRVEVQKLKDSLSDVDLPQAATDALARLDTALKGVDEINPDA